MKSRNGFTLIELMIVIAIVSLMTTVIFRFYNEGYVSHNFSLQQDMMRLRSAKVLVRYLEADLQKYGSAAERTSESGEKEIILPASGKVGVRYRQEPSGELLRYEDEVTVSLLNDLTQISISPYFVPSAMPDNTKHGLYSLRLAFQEHSFMHSPLEKIVMILGTNPINEEYANANQN